MRGLFAAAAGGPMLLVLLTRALILGRSGVAGAEEDAPLRKSSGADPGVFALWRAVDREVCVEVDDGFGAASAPFCFDFVTEDAVAAALRYCAKEGDGGGQRCCAAQAEALAFEALHLVRAAGAAAEAELRRRFQRGLAHNSTCATSAEEDDLGAHADPLLVEKMARLRYEAGELLAGRLPRPEAQCAVATAGAYAAIIGLPPVEDEGAWESVGAALSGPDWAQLAESFAAGEFYEHAMACVLRSYDVVLRQSKEAPPLGGGTTAAGGPRGDLQLALMASAWGDTDVAIPLFGRAVADATRLAHGAAAAAASSLSSKKDGTTTSEELLLLLFAEWVAVARAARFDAVVASAPPIVPALEDLEAYRAGLRADLTMLATDDDDDPSSSSSALSAAAQRAFVSKIGRTLFHVAHQCINEVRDQQLLGLALRRAAPDVLSPRPHASASLRRTTTDDDGNLEPPASPTGLRLGFVSAYLTEHSIGKMLGEVIALLSAEPDIECYVFHIVGAPARSPDSDHVRRFIDANAASRDLRRDDLDAQRAAIVEAHLDVLVFPDVGMELATYFLAFSRLARVQAVWWGHPTTTGLSTVDFYLSLDTEVDDAQDQYSEQLVNTAPFSPSDLKRDMAVVKPLSAFAPHAAPDDHLYVILGRLFKLHPAFDPTLVHILTADRRVVSRLWARLSGTVRRLLAHDPELRDSVLRRIVFVDYWNYMHVLANAAVVLDTYPYGGCLTALDALSNGVPLVTLPSDYERGRFAMSIYRQMGLGDYIAVDAADFVRIATTLATDHAAHAAAVEQIRAHYADAHRPRRIAKEWAPVFRNWATNVP